MNRFCFRSFLLAVLSFSSVFLAFGNAEAPVSGRHQDLIAGQVEEAMKAAGDLEASQKAVYREILEEYLVGARALRGELLRVSLAKELANSPERKELRQRLGRLSDTTYAKAAKILRGKSRKGARSYFRSQKRQASVYEDAADSWHAFEKELAAAKLEERQLAGLKLSVLPFFVRYHTALAGPSFAPGASGAAGKAARERILQASKAPKAVAKELLTAEQLESYYAAITETTRVVGRGAYVSTVRSL